MLGSSVGALDNNSSQYIFAMKSQTHFKLGENQENMRNLVWKTRNMTKHWYIVFAEETLYQFSRIGEDAVVQKMLTAYGSGYLYLTRCQKCPWLWLWRVLERNHASEVDENHQHAL
ncbi:hypothetical protein NPIL_112341 [Nephila pilipes]|uniref:Uncharacterized protein n=1 Tax=Nephila pilipes TaxID=299642 RepID=A0A8X6T5G0_NEPPI|nr:hypothetical protein NPIL_112341 [Nephila pilipes]